MVAIAQKEKLIEQIQKVEDVRLWQQIESLLIKFEKEHHQKELLLKYVTLIKTEKTDIEDLKREQKYKKMTLKRWEELVANIDMDDPIEEIEKILAS